MEEDRRHNSGGAANRPLVELLSVYLDDQEALSSTEIEHIEVLLAEDEAARQIYAELQVVTQELSSLPQVEAPRSYHLNAEMVGVPEPIVLQESSVWYARHAATVRWATAAAAVLFVFVLGADLVINGVVSDPDDSSSVTELNQAEMTNRDASDDDEAAGGADELEAVEEEAGDDTSGGSSAGAAAALVPEGGGAEDGEVESTGDSGEPVGAGQDDAAEEPTIAALTGETEAEDSAGSNDLFAFDQGQSVASDETSERRLWRFAEFGLVVVLGLLITAMVVLPRLGGRSARAGSE